MPGGIREHRTLNSKTLEKQTRFLVKKGYLRRLSNFCGGIEGFALSSRDFFVGLILSLNRHIPDVSPVIKDIQVSPYARYNEAHTRCIIRRIIPRRHKTHASLTGFIKIQRAINVFNANNTDTSHDK